MLIVTLGGGVTQDVDGTSCLQCTLLGGKSHSPKSLSPYLTLRPGIQIKKLEDKKANMKIQFSSIFLYMFIL